MQLTIQEFSKRFKIPLSKLRQVESAGMLKFRTSQTPDIDSIRYYLARGQRLTAGHLRYLLLHPESIAELVRYESAIDRQIALIGNAGADALDQDGMHLIDLASLDEPDKVETFARWIAGVIPAKGCGYHYIAVRALLNVPEPFFALSYKQINRAILNARAHNALAGMSETKNRQTRFFHPMQDL